MTRLYTYLHHTVKQRWTLLGLNILIYLYTKKHPWLAKSHSIINKSMLQQSCFGEVELPVWLQMICLKELHNPEFRYTNCQHPWHALKTYKPHLYCSDWKGCQQSVANKPYHMAAYIRQLQPRAWEVMNSKFMSTNGSKGHLMWGFYKFV